jgi:hypothetical protein
VPFCANLLWSDLAAHLDDVSPDGVTDFLHQTRFLPRQVWKLGKDRLEESKEAGLRVEERVHEKRYSRFIDLVRAQYSGHEPRVVKGSGVVSLGHRGGKEKPLDPIDSRVYAPDVDGKPKKAHCQAMFVHARAQTQLRARPSLVDGWDACAEKLKGIHRRKRPFVTTLKSHRLVSLSKEQGDIPLDAVAWTPVGLTSGVLIQWKEVPFHVRLFKLVAPDGDSDGVSTHDLAEPRTAQGAKDSRDVRGQVEALHRGLKHLTGTEKCQCRAARAQRNPLAGCSHAWVSLTGKAKELGQTRSALRESLFSHYLRAELPQPHIVAC